MLKSLVGLSVALLVLCGCNKASTPEPSAGTPAEKTQAAKPAPVPADVPVPPGMTGRSDSGLPGTEFHVIQGTIPSPLPETIESLRQIAKTNGWSEKSPAEGAADPAVASVTFEKDTRTCKATLVRRSNSETTVNLMTGPK